MNRGLYGNPQPLGAPARIAPPAWLNYDLITATTSTWTVPENVFQILAMVWGGGAAGTDNNGGGGGGGFAMGILNVKPGQVLPTITIGAGGATSGASGGTTSIGTTLSATGGVTQGAGGDGTTESGLRGAFTASGGTANNTVSSSGAASGSPYGNGGSPPASGGKGGAAWGDQAPSASLGASTPVSGAPSSDGFLAIARKGGLSGQGGTSNTAIVGIGCGSFSHYNINADGPHPVFGGGGGSGATGAGGKGGRGGGGGGGGNGGGGLGGSGAVILFWTEGY